MLKTLSEVRTILYERRFRSVGDNNCNMCQTDRVIFLVLMKIMELLQDTPQLLTTSFTCVKMLCITRHNTIDTIVIQRDARVFCNLAEIIFCSSCVLVYIRHLASTLGL